MGTTSEMKAITLRIPPKLYADLTQSARRRSQSVNAYIQRNLETILRVEEETARYDAYTLLGSDAEEASVDYAIHAQAEVMLHDDNA